MPKDDVVRLRHMMDAAGEVMSFVQGRLLPNEAAPRVGVASFNGRHTTL